MQMNHLPSNKKTISTEVLKVVERLPGAVLVSKATGTGEGPIIYAN